MARTLDDIKGGGSLMPNPLPKGSLHVQLESTGHIVAFFMGEHVGRLDYAPDGFVTAVDVYKSSMRRRGIATAMTDYLRDVVGITPSFAPPDCGNTPEGDAWVAYYQTRP